MTDILKYLANIFWKGFSDLLWWVTTMASDSNFENLAKPVEVGWVQLSMILKTILSLNHRNASAERGFNINKNLLDANMS